MSDLMRSLIGLLLATAILIPAGGSLGSSASFGGDTGMEAVEETVLDRGRYQAPDGTLFSYTKTRSGETLFEAGDLRLTLEELRTWETSHPRPVVDPQLLKVAEQMDPETQLTLAVFLRHQPAGLVARQVRAGFQNELDRLAESIREVQRSLRPATSLAPGEELALVRGLAQNESLLSPIQLSVVRSVAARVEALGEEMRTEIRQRVEGEIAVDQNALALQVEGLAGTVTGRTQLLSSLTVSLPARSLAELATDSRVARIEALAPGSPELDFQAVSLGLTNGFWPQGHTGGSWDAGVLDTGVQQDHPNLNPGSWLSMAGTTDSNGHGTGVAGIIMSDDATFRGMAYGLDTMLVGSASSGTVMNNADWMVSIAAEDPEAINLSFGYGTASDVDYSSFDQFFDGLVDGTGTLLTKSAGNGGNGTTTITHPAPAYNILAVANMDDKNTATRADDELRFSSSRGPTLAGRKKPDVTAPGHNSFTTNNDWAGPVADFVNLGGTSAAAPHVAGAALLVTEVLGARDPMATKAVLINTADSFTDAGTSGDLSDDGPVNTSEWNKTYGWGYLDLLEAWLNGTDVFVGSLDAPFSLTFPPPVEPNVKLYTGFMTTGEKATLVWNRHVAYNGSATPTLVEDLSDLDLYAYRQSDGAEVATSTSLIDNVEQIAAPADETYILKVRPGGAFDSDVPTESFALATEELFEVGELPALEVSELEGPIMASPGQPFLIETLVLTTSSNLSAFDTTATLTLPPGFVLESPSASLDLGELTPTGGAAARWTARAPCLEGQDTVTINATSNSYGEIFAASLGLTFDIDVDLLVPEVRTIGRVTPRTFQFPVLATSWTGVGVDGDGDDKDLSADDELCLPTPYQTSSVTGGDSPDVILVNGRTLGAGSHYALVEDPTFLFDYSVEMEHAASIATPLSGTTSAAGSFDGDDIVDVFEVSLAAGSRYFVEVTPSANLDIALFGFRPDRDSGGRQDADYSAEIPGDDGPVGVTVVAPVSGWYGFAVVNDDELESGTYEVTVRNGLFADGFESGDATAWSLIVP